MKVKLNEFEKETIKTVFKQCFGMQSCLRSERTQKSTIDSLASRTGFNRTFLQDNIEEICNL